MGKSPVPIIIAIFVIILAVVYLYDNGKISSSINQQLPTIKDVFTNTQGQVIGSISFIKPNTPPPVNQVQQALMNQQPQQTLTVQNESTGTPQKPINSSISLTSQQLTYGSAQTGTVNLQGVTTASSSTTPTWTLGSRVVIAGTIQIIDPSTLNSTNPRTIPPPYQYHLVISCKFRGCDMDDIGVTNGITDSAGGFSYAWTTSAVINSAGEYSATVLALTSDTLNGVPYQMTSTYYFNMIN